MTLWVFAQSPLSEDNVALGARATAGHQFGGVLILMLIVLYGAGLAAGFQAVAPRARARPHATARGNRPDRRAVRCAAGRACIAMAMSHRGLTGSISYGFNQLTNPHAKQPPNDPSRLTAVGSVRARYWNDALKEWKAHPVKGVGAGGYATARDRVRLDNLNVQHAHGYVVQTLADLGLIGLALSLALLAAWLAASLRTIGRVPAGATVSAGADRHADAAVRGRRVRRALADRLDVVHPRQRGPGAAVRRLAGGARPADRRHETGLRGAADCAAARGAAPAACRWRAGPWR